MTMLKQSFLIAALAVPSLAVASGVSFPEGTACVAWKTKKTMFLFKKLEPVGLNCAAKAKILSEGGGKRVTVSAPIASFDSGEKMRDQEVLKILKADVQPDLVFTSRVYAPAEWESVRSGKSAAIEGAVKIGGEEFPVVMPLVLTAGSEPVVEGSLATTFTAFKITPPTVAGGLVARVQDYLELHYRIPLSKVDAKP